MKKEMIKKIHSLMIIYSISAAPFFYSITASAPIKNNIFGTGGIRSHIGTDLFTIPSLIKFGNAIGAWAQDKFKRPVKILLGTDTRQSCAMVQSALQCGLLPFNCTLYDAGVQPTPTISQIVNYGDQFDLGVIISASHNPFHDNGVKIMYAPEGKISLADELDITQKFYAQDQETIYDSLGAVIQWNHAHTTYLETIKRFFHSNFLNGKKIVLDCAQGATYLLAPYVFQAFGAQVVVINNTPDGYNINKQCGTLHLESLQKAVQDNSADIGFAFDGDGDRVIAVNNRGEVKDGDDILALLIQHPAYEKEVGIVGTIMTNQGLAVELRNTNKILLRTNVGEKYITQAQDEKHMLIGGEPNGHCMLRDYMPSGDGIFAALRVLEVATIKNDFELKTFTKFPQININLPIKHKKDLATPYFKKLIHNYEEQIPQGRIVVRYSGTEPLLRILVEDAHNDTAQKIAAELSRKLQQELAS